MKTLKSILIGGNAFLFGLCFAALLTSCGRDYATRENKSVKTVSYADPVVNDNAVVVQDTKPAAKVYDTIHVSARGKKYVNVVSKKSGKTYRKYIK